jgi:signal transduction histidine kinase
LDSVALPREGNLTLVPEPRGKRAANLERSQEAALTAIGAVASYLDSDDDLPAFFGRLGATVAGLCRARRVAFWRVGNRGTLSVQQTPHGFDRDSGVHRARLSFGPGDGALERVVFGDELDLVKGTAADMDDVWRRAGLTEVRTSIAAAWRAGERHVGVVAAYDARGGFNAHDLWLLRVAGMATGLLWQYKESEDELGHTAIRLEEAMAARRHLLNNIAAGGDEARRRFASALHDDSLQLLTGAELQLERVRAEPGVARQAVQLDQLRTTLRKVEDSLRRLLTTVSPEPLELPGDLTTVISERLESLRTRAGIESHVHLALPEAVSDAIRVIVLKNVGEALNNVEKHAHATRVSVVGEAHEGGVRVEVKDDGTGFVVAESVRMPGHIGLVAVKERAHLAGGWTRIESEPGNGTTLEFWVPVTL